MVNEVIIGRRPGSYPILQTLKRSRAILNSMSDEVTNFIAGCPKKQTPNNQSEDIFQIKYTGE